MIRLVLCDSDGTLIPFGNKTASPRTLRAIDEVLKSGVRFGLATGRDTGELESFFGPNDHAYRTGILSNGKKIFVDGELVRYTPMNREAVERLAAFVSSFANCFVTASPLSFDNSSVFYCLNAPADEVERVSNAFGINVVPVDRLPEEVLIATTVSCPLGQEVLDYIKEEGARLCPEFDFLQPAPHWCDVLPRGLNKGTALPMLLEELGISAEEVVVFGDAENDISLFAAVEHSVAVANATPAAKVAARWHIGDSKDGAVAQALEDIARAAREGGMPAFMGA